MKRLRELVKSELFRIAAPVLILAFGLGGYFLLAAVNKPPSTVADKDQQSEDQEVETVRTDQVMPYDGAISIEASGIVVPYREIPLPTQVAGRIKAKESICRAGNFVEKGAKLFEIDDADLQLQQRQAQAAVNEVQSDIDSTRAQLKLAQRQYDVEKRENDRERKLRGAISDADLDRSERELLVAENTVLTQQSKLSLLEISRLRLDAALDQVKLDRRRTTITAPVSGVIVKEFAEQDQFVNKGETLVTIEDTSKVEVRCNLQKEDLQWLWLSDPQTAPSQKESQPAALYGLPKSEAQVIYDLAGFRFAWRGTLDRYDGIGLDSTTRTVPVRILVDQPRAAAHLKKKDELDRPTPTPPALLRGMYVTVNIRAKPQVALFTIQPKALWPGKRIWLVRDGKLLEQSVRIAGTVKSGLIIQAEGGAINRSDRVLISPLEHPLSGQRVVEAESTDSAPPTTSQEAAGK